MKKSFQRILAVGLATIALIVIAAVPAQATVYHGCPSGVGCMWYDKDGAGTRLTIAVGTYGTEQCWSISGLPGDNKTSSASADYGNGLDLQIYASADCSWGVFARVNVLSSNFVNFTGALSYFNDSASSFKITHA